MVFGGLLGFLFVCFFFNIVLAKFLPHSIHMAFRDETCFSKYISLACDVRITYPM